MPVPVRPPCLLGARSGLLPRGPRSPCRHSTFLSVMAPVNLELYVYLIVDDFSLCVHLKRGVMIPTSQTEQVRSKWGGGVWKALSQSSINDITITDFHFTTIPV